MTLAVTFTVAFVCLLIKRHYNKINKKLRQLDIQLKQPVIYPLKSVVIDPKEPTAVIFVGKSQGVAMHTLLNVIRTFPNHFKNFVFLSAGIVDVTSFVGQAELRKMREKVNDNLQYFVDYCHQYSVPAEYYSVFGTDVVDELTVLSEKITKKYPNCLFFSSKLVFDHDNFITRFLHNETALALQRNLHLQEKELVILPVRI